MNDEPLQYCWYGCGRETGFFTNTGRRSKVFCTECDEERIKRISKQLHDLEERFNAKRG